MKNICILMVMLTGIASLKGQDMKVMTYNIRYATANDGENQWDFRKEFLCDQIAFHSPDLIGIQEGLSQQVSFIKKYLGIYRYVGVGREDGKEKGEYCAIFYNPAKFKLLSEDTFWLSKTPEKVSVGWDAAMERIATYALFQDNVSGKRFFVVNTHFDHVGTEARQKSAMLIVERIRGFNTENLPVILMGDLNLGPDSEPIAYLRRVYKDTRVVSRSKPFGPKGTFNNFTLGESEGDQIDYIFVTDRFEVDKFAILTDHREGRYPSDHFPVLAELRWASAR